MSTQPIQSPTLGQRIMAEEPGIFKVIKIVCALMLLAAAILAKIQAGSSFLIDILSIGGTSGFAVASLTVKDVALLLNQGLTVTNVLQVADDAVTEVQQVKAAIKMPPPAPDLNTAIKDAESAIQGSDTGN